MSDQEGPSSGEISTGFGKGEATPANIIPTPANQEIKVVEPDENGMYRPAPPRTEQQKRSEAGDISAPEIIRNTDEWIENGLSAKSEEEINQRIENLLEAGYSQFEDDAEFNEVLEMIRQGNTDIEDISQKMDKTTRGRLLGQIAYLQDYRALKKGSLEFTLPKTREAELLRQDIDEKKISSFREGIKIKLEQSGRVDAEAYAEELTGTVQQMMDSEIPEIRLAGTRLLAGVAGPNLEPVEVYFREHGANAKAVRDMGYYEESNNRWIVELSSNFFSHTKFERQRMLTHEMNHADLYAKLNFANWEEYGQWIQNPTNIVKAEQRAIYGDISVLRQAQKLASEEPSLAEDFLAMERTWKTLELADRVSNNMGINGDMYVALLYGLVHGRAPLDKDSNSIAGKNS